MDEQRYETRDAFQKFYTILKRLRAPGGCPWDRKQTERTLAPLILEEAFEVTDAIEKGDPAKVSEELGDLTMNVLMTALVAEDKGLFRTKEIYEKITRKLINRHPHVFGDEQFKEEGQFLRRWEDIKRNERRENHDDTSAIAGVPSAMPSLLRGIRLVEKLKRTGADLPFFRTPLEDVQELIKGLEEPEKEIPSKTDEQRFGRLFLAMIILGINRGVNLEMTFKSFLNSLENSFRHMEEVLGERLSGASAGEIDRLWRETGQGGPPSESD